MLAQHKSKRLGLTIALVAVCPATGLIAQTSSPLADDRLQLLPIAQKLKVAEPNDIPLRISDPNVKTIVVDWGIYSPGSSIPEWNHEYESSEYKLLPSPDGTFVIHFTPSVVGKLNLRVLVFFEDGKLARKSEDVETVLPDRSPEAFFIQDQPNRRFNENRMYATVGDTQWLSTVAYYSGFEQPIRLRAADVVFHVLNDPRYDPLQLDPATGKIKSVNTGRALVQADFGGLTTFTCILVFGSRAGGSSDDCRDLLPPGKSLPPQPKFTPPLIKTVPPSNPPPTNQ
jgi:hypothetical protein